MPSFRDHRVDKAIYEGDMGTLEEEFRKGYNFLPYHTSLAIQEGRIFLLSWFYERGVRFDEESFIDATEKGDEEILFFLKTINCPEGKA